MIGIGLVGRGYMGARHAAAYAAMEDVRVVGLAGRDDWRELVSNPAVDAVDVTFPTARHGEVVLAALMAGKHVFCETPLCETAGEAEAMLAAARARGRILQVALLSRFAHPGTRVRESILGGGLGVLRAVTLRRIAPGTGSAHHGDAILELMLFDLDWCHWTLREATVVSAAAVAGPGGRLDHATALLDCGGVLATVEASYLAPKGQVFRTIAEAYGDGGAVVAEFRAEPGAQPTASVTFLRSGSEPTREDGFGPDPVAAECRHFVDVVAGRADASFLDASQALASLRTLDAIRASTCRAR